MTEHAHILHTSMLGCDQEEEVWIIPNDTEGDVGGAEVGASEQDVLAYMFSVVGSWKITIKKMEFSPPWL